MNWFQRRMQEEQGGPIPVPQQVRQAPPPVPSNYPQNYAQPVGNQQTQTIDTSQLEMTPENIKMMAGLWTGGEGTATERNLCPQCGSHHYFSRAKGNLRGPAPAPMCYTCGFNGMFDQADSGAWGQ